VINNNCYESISGKSLNTIDNVDVTRGQLKARHNMDKPEVEGNHSVEDTESEFPVESCSASEKQPREVEKTTMESDEEDEVDGLFSKIKKSKIVKTIACGLGIPKSDSEDKEPYVQAEKQHDERFGFTGEKYGEPSFNRGSAQGQEFEERLSYRRAISGSTLQQMKDKHREPGAHHKSYTVPIALNEEDDYSLREQEHESSTHTSIPAQISTASVDDEDVYNFSHPKRGYMIVLVNDTFYHQPFRDGASRDLQNAREMAEMLGYEIQNKCMWKNLNRQLTMKILTQAQKTDHSNCDSFAIIVSTHGLEKPNPKAMGKMDHALVCADDRMIFTSTLTEMFSDENCPSLRGKPKFFIIQACRGNNDYIK